MRNKILFLFSYLILLSGCHTQSTVNIISKLQSNGLTQKFEVPTGSYFSGIINGNEKPYVVFIDQKIKVISLYSIRDSSFGKYDLKLFIDSNTLADNSIHDICIINKDSIIVLLDNMLIELTKNSLLFNISNYESNNSNNLERVFYDFFGVSHLVFDSLNRVIYLRVIPTALERYKKSYWKENILGILNLDNKKLEVLPISYPDFFHNEYVGDVESPLINLDNNNLLITFLPTEDYIIYNHNSRHLTYNKFPKSNFREPASKYFKWGKEVHIKKRLDNLVVNGIYDNLIILPNYKGYCRFYRQGIPLRNIDGTFNSKMDKQISMMVISTNNNLIDEFVFPKDTVYNTYNCFISNNIIYINNSTKDAQQSDFIHFDGFELPKQ